ncbi:cytoplasmic protein [Verrucomicrobia bacterium LW23]|nr:cytoplasmic protein [Verrucomicrobia bacterium LW23]
MTVSAHAERWMGFPVKDYLECLEKRQALDFEGTVYRVASERYGSEISYEQIFRQWAEHPDAALAPGVVVGSWLDEDWDGDSARAVALLVEYAPRLPRLRGLFFGDITSEENEISWIQNSDISPLLNAFPLLETFRVRGSSGLSLGALRHSTLRSLTVESGGLERTIIEQITASRLPMLEELEIWLGSDGYGADHTLADLLPLLDPARFPRLRRLGLCNCEYQDEVAKAVAESAIAPQLEGLKLSMGTLGDVGGMALVGPKSRLGHSLRALDLHHNYLSERVIEQITAVFPFANVDENEGEEDPDDRYISVSE